MQAQATGQRCPASVANANAQMNSADAARQHRGQRQGDVASDVGEGQHDPAGGGGQARPTAQAPAEAAAVVAPDQLNDVDRALQESQSLDGCHADGRDGAGQAGAAGSRRSGLSNDDSAWDKTSLIGKIFIAFGALLTMASAARMFMA